MVAGSLSWPKRTRKRLSDDSVHGAGNIGFQVKFELVARFKDQAIRDEVANFKRHLNGCLSPEAMEGISPESGRPAC